MNYQDYLKFEKEYGAGSDEAGKAYLQLVVTELKPITKEAVFDQFDHLTITLKDSITMSGETLLYYIDFLSGLDGAFYKIRGNQIRFSS